MEILEHVEDFTTYFGQVKLRPYQTEAAEAVIESIFRGDGESFVWKFARQSGKDETLTALYLYLLTVLSHRDTSIVAAAPTFMPQTGLAMRRMDKRLERNIVLRKEWKRDMRHSYRVRQAGALFYSANSNANVVGATAWPLLVINEAQDVMPATYDKRFAPMAAANNATRLFSGTAWTRETLLAREERYCRQKEERDGRKRVFVVDAEEVRRVHPPYGEFLKGEVERLGANHPIVLSQYMCQEIDAQTGMFNEGRLSLIRAPEKRAEAVPQPGSVTCAFLLDVAGQDESRLHDAEAALTNPGRDAVTLRVVEVDRSSVEVLRAPTYRVVHTRQWVGENHLRVFGQLKALYETWRPQHIVIDATGVGEGLWAMLDKAFPTRVIAVRFNAQTKSEIGYRFLAVIETGRFRDLVPTPETDRQYAACRAEVMIGPRKTMRWGVPDGARDENGELIHDDILMADALVVELDKLDWRMHTSAFEIRFPDPLDEMSHFREPSYKERKAWYGEDEAQNWKP